MVETSKEDFIKKIRSTYKETQDIPDYDIETQMEFAKIIVEQDVEEDNLKEKFKDMGIVYLTCHYLYLNLSKTKKDALQNFTSKERAVGVLGKGYEASPFGQQYMLISNKKSEETSKNSTTTSSGIKFL